jgi:hypothetical protein
MYTVYLESEQVGYWLKSTDVAVNVTQDLNAWACADKKIAMIEVLNFDQATHNIVSFVINQADLILLFMPEFVTDSWCREFDRSNVVMLLGGQLNWQPQHARFGKCLYLLWSTCDFYQAKPELLSIPGATKTHVFDVLLGRRKHHRDRLYNNIDHSQNVVTYFPTEHDQDITQYSSKQFQWPTDVLPRSTDPVNFTVQEVTVDGTIVSLSQILPREIYQHTWYSVVAETETSNSWSFFTEKIVKPILAKRLFVVCSGQYYLRNLRKLGFRTFHDIIDESYDAEPDLTKRIELLLCQVNMLCQQDHVALQEQIKPIVEHNFSVMLGANWQKQMIDEISCYITELS